MQPNEPMDPEHLRLQQDAAREKNWKRWGPYLAERQWATVREDYSGDGSCWDFFPHDHARSRAYRWGEDGLLGITDRECRLCFSLALWNHKDPILKERLFGLTGVEGNHGEDVKELYYYLDSTPTHSYMKALYKYPQAEYPYDRLVAENKKRSRAQGEFELEHAGVFEEKRYFDVFAEYAKAGPDDLLIRITAENRGPDAAPLCLIPQLWFRNTWAWGYGAKPGEDDDAAAVKPVLRQISADVIQATHPTLGTFFLAVDAAGAAGGKYPELLFTENETNNERIFGRPNASPYVKDAFDQYLVHGAQAGVNPQHAGTKAGALFRMMLAPGEKITLRLRLTADARVAAEAGTAARQAFGDFDAIFAKRLAEADAFFLHQLNCSGSAEHRNISRQAFAGVLWSKQFYYYVVEEWRKGDPCALPPPGHAHTRNTDWNHLHSRDVISMPDKWEYPWFAAWDLAFHMVALAKLDGHFAKSQLELLLREWYMHPNGQIPAYEFAFSDVNPPVHAWAVWRVYKMTAPRGQRDIAFLERCFHKLMLNFTWWVNRKDVSGRHLFSGGFLGLDNIGIFDRSKPLPNGECLEQADGTAWMAFYCSTMLAIAIELAMHNPAYEDIASKFFEHFVAIVDAINTLGGTGLWDDTDGFYYDHLRADDHSTPLRVRSLVGLVPLFAVEVFDQQKLEKLPGFTKRMKWFLDNRRDLARNIAYMDAGLGHNGGAGNGGQFLLAVPSKNRLSRVLRYVFDDAEFFSPFGIRSVSKVHKDKPFSLEVNGENHGVSYCPGESDTALFGGNSNWRGPIWMPMNYLLLEALERYEHFYGPEMPIELPGRTLPLCDAIRELRKRLVSLFLPDGAGRRPCHGDSAVHRDDPAARNLLLFHEYFHADTGQGLGASHQTGWTALCVHLLDHRRNLAHAFHGAEARDAVGQAASAV